VVALTALLLRHYASPEVSLVVYCSTGVAWLTAMSIVALVPIDVWATMSQQPVPQIGTLWDLSYWITFFLTWLIIPIHQGYVDAGDFTISGRLRTSIRDNLLFWLVMIVVGVIGIAMLIFMAHFDLQDLPGYGIALSNAFGLLAAVFLLGFGLIHIPKMLWSQASPEVSLRTGVNKLGKLAEKVDDACFELSTVATVVQATRQQMNRRDPLREYMDIIYTYAEEESPIKPSAVAGANGFVDMEAMSVDDLDYGTTIKGLASLRRRVKRAVNIFKGARQQYCSKANQVQELDEICKSRRTRDYKTRSSVPQVLWIYKCLVRPWVLRLCAVVLGAVSLCVIFAEATIGAGRHPDLSPFSIVIHAEQNRAEIGLQLLVLLPLVYMCTCTYYSLFKLGIFSSFYFMVPGSTSSFSLLVNAALMCRFAPPLCYNFMHIIHVDDPTDGESQATTFAKKMAAMDLIPLLGSEFNKWFPLVLVAYCGILALTSMTGCHCMEGFVPGRLTFDKDEEPDDEHSERGRTLLRKEQEARTKGMALGSGLGLDAWYTGRAGTNSQIGRPAAAPSGSAYRSSRSSSGGGASANLEEDGAHLSGALGGAGRAGWWPWRRAAAETTEQSLLPSRTRLPSNVTPPASAAPSLDNIFASLGSSRNSNPRLDEDTIFR